MRAALSPAWSRLASHSLCAGGADFSNWAQPTGVLILSKAHTREKTSDPTTRVLLRSTPTSASAAPSGRRTRCSRTRARWSASPSRTWAWPGASSSRARPTASPSSAPVRPAPHQRHLRLLTRHAARAELVAAILKKGGLMCAHPPAAPCAPARLSDWRCALERSAASNPGAATPESLHRLYKNQAAVTANPYTLRQFNSNARTGFSAKSIGFSAILSGAPGPPAPRYKRQESRKRGDSPPRQSFRYVNIGGYQTDSAVLLRR